MEPKFNTSFIPKQAQGGAPGAPFIIKRSRTFNIISLGSSIIFGLTIATFIGLHIYKAVIVKNITQASQDVDSARGSFEPEKIQTLVDSNSRIIIAKTLLDKHVVLSPLLSLLQSLTVKKIRFSSLTYLGKNAEPLLTLDAESQTYNALVEQSSVFGNDEHIKTNAVSAFNLTDNGIIKARFTLTIDPAVLSYKNMLASPNLNQ